MTLEDVAVMYELRLGDGRTMRVREYGAASGFPVIALHGLPGSGSKFSMADGVARELGLRLIAPDRWSYGGTSPHSAPSLAAFGADIAELSERLGLVRIAVMGVSGGGPFTAGVAAVLGAQVLAAAFVSPVGPLTGIAERPYLTPFHRLCFHYLPRVPGALGVTFRLFRLANRHAPGLACRITTARSAPVDRATIALPDVGARLARTFREGLEPGVGGPLTDMNLFSRPWGIDLTRISAPSRVWIGTRDANVPIAAAKLLAEMIPGARIDILEGEGHLWLSLHYADVLGWIAELLQEQGTGAVVDAAETGMPTSRHDQAKAERGT